MIEALETIERDGYTASIYQSEDAMGPDEWDTFGILVFETRGHGVGVRPKFFREYDMQDWTPIDAVAILPVYAYDDRMGCVLEVADSWEQANGYIYATQATADTTGVPADAFLAALEQELATWNQYLQGDVYDVAVTNPAGDVVDSCGGFYGLDDAMSEARGMLDGAITQEVEQSAKIAAMMRE